MKQLLFPLQMTKANDEPVNSLKEKKLIFIEGKGSCLVRIYWFCVKISLVKKVDSKNRNR